MRPEYIEECATWNEPRKEWLCKNCGSIIMSQTVARSMHLKDMLGGFGQCQYDEIPYCPKCEVRPNYHGKPVIIGSGEDIDTKELRVISKMGDVDE